MKRLTENAVSPVVGVMLMLVVVIIIAAVVSAFAGGLGTNIKKAPQVSLEVTPVIQDIQDQNTGNYVPDYPVGFTADNGLLFEHSGGDPFDLKEIEVHIQYTDSKIKIGTNDILPSPSCNSTAVKGYLMKIGAADSFISAGDKFMLYADNCRIDKFGSQISWQPAGAARSFSIPKNARGEYTVVDKTSGKAIQQGTFIFL